MPDADPEYDAEDSRFFDESFDSPAPHRQSRLQAVTPASRPPRQSLAGSTLSKQQPAPAQPQSHQPQQPQQAHRTQTPSHFVSRPRIARTPVESSIRAPSGHQQQQQPQQQQQQKQQQQHLGSRSAPRMSVGRVEEPFDSFETLDEAGPSFVHPQRNAITPQASRRPQPVRSAQQMQSSHQLHLGPQMSPAVQHARLGQPQQPIQQVQQLRSIHVQQPQHQQQHQQHLQPGAVLGVTYDDTVFVDESDTVANVAYVSHQGDVHGALPAGQLVSMPALPAQIVEAQEQIFDQQTHYVDSDGALVAPYAVQQVSAPPGMIVVRQRSVRRPAPLPGRFHEYVQQDEIQDEYIQDTGAMDVGMPLQMQQEMQPPVQQRLVTVQFQPHAQRPTPAQVQIQTVVQTAQGPRLQSVVQDTATVKVQSPMRQPIARAPQYMQVQRQQATPHACTVIQSPQPQRRQQQAQQAQQAQPMSRNQAPPPPPLQHYHQHQQQQQQQPQQQYHQEQEDFVDDEDQYVQDDYDEQERVTKRQRAAQPRHQHQHQHQRPPQAVQPQQPQQQQQQQPPQPQNQPQQKQNQQQHQHQQQQQIQANAFVNSPQARPHRQPQAQNPSALPDKQPGVRVVHSANSFGAPSSVKAEDPMRHRSVSFAAQEQHAESEPEPELADDRAAPPQPDDYYYDDGIPDAYPDNFDGLDPTAQADDSGDRLSHDDDGGAAGAATSDASPIHGQQNGRPEHSKPAMRTTSNGAQRKIAPEVVADSESEGEPSVPPPSRAQQQQQKQKQQRQHQRQPQQQQQQQQQPHEGQQQQQKQQKKQQQQRTIRQLEDEDGETDIVESPRRPKPAAATRPTAQQDRGATESPAMQQPAARRQQQKAKRIETNLNSDDDQENTRPAAASAASRSNPAAQAVSSPPAPVLSAKRKRGRAFVNGHDVSLAATSAGRARGGTSASVKVEYDDDSDVRLKHEDDRDDASADGMRRSRRTKVPPVAYWKNERIVYGRRVSGVGVVPTSIKEVIRIPSDDEGTSSSRRARTRIKREVHDSVPDEIAVRDMETNEEVMKQVVVVPQSLRSWTVGEGDYRFQKVFSEGDFLASGILVLPQGAHKPSKSSSDAAMIFVVLSGHVDAAINRTWFTVSQGAQFYVPRGNTYEIKNASSKEARLFFCHGKEIKVKSKTKG
ncbi:mitotic fidelity of chromosome transmission-related protein [Polyrhizophydium stewartii]|uniref:Mitotic fidelity of chromosome transmission-related protein n=1 Tax=Polyrhizophydium stewartii TaxID=2732419 RepID=A0ABR4N9B5_9FUNG